MTSETQLHSREVWRGETRLHSGEVWRKVYHISAGLSALGLPFLGWPTMAARHPPSKSRRLRSLLEPCKVISHVERPPSGR